MAALFVCAFALGESACARIPAEAIQVNTILHGNIADAQNKHEALVSAFFKARKDGMDDFFIHTYEPEFLRNFKISWDKVRPTDPFDINKPAHRAEYEQNVIARYQEMSSQIDATESDFKKQLDQAYGSMLQQNDAIGKLLKSAKAVSDADKAAWNSSVGQLMPGLATDAIDAKFKAIKDNLINTVTTK